MSVGPWPAEARASASRVAARTASDVVPVDLDPGNPVPLAPLGDGGVRLQAHRLRDGPLVVLAEEDDGHDVAGGEAEGLGDVTLARGAVTEVGQRGRGGAVERDAERVAGGVERL